MNMKNVIKHAENVWKNRQITVKIKGKTLNKRIIGLMFNRGAYFSQMLVSGFRAQIKRTVCIELSRYVDLTNE